MQQVEQADHLQLAKWYRFLWPPADDGEVTIMNRITERFKALGFFTPEISKQIGW
jgi:hypothetical protein